MLESVCDNRLEKGVAEYTYVQRRLWGVKQTPFFGARTRTEDRYIYQSVCRKNQHQVKTQNEKSENGKWEIHSPVICQKNKKKI